VSHWSAPAIGLSVFGAIFVSLNNLLLQANSEDAVAPTVLSSQSQADKGSSQPTVHPAVSTVPTTLDIFINMRAALATAKLRARELKSYTAILEMQEEVNGNLREMDSIQIKLRQEPFSVYMRWHDNGQEALFVRGQNGDRLLAKPTNGLAALKRLWRLDPDSRMAKQSCRYPITESGIENLVNRVHAFYAARDDWSSAVNCSVSRSSEADRIVTKYCLQFRDKSVSPEYLESRLSFDHATGLLIDVQNLGWTDDESPRIVEHYAYRAIDQSATLTDSDFDVKNSEYEFVAR
jgi:hypothetical protein